MTLVLKIDGVTYDMHTAALHNAIKRLQAELDTAKEENKQLRDALQDLYDEQNGPPLLRDEVSWQAAMDKAEKLLESDHEKG